MKTNPPKKRAAGRGRDITGKPNPVDVHVGARVRLRRTLMGMSQEKLGEAIGLTFQQVQKYERGANRIGASRLWDLSKVLDVPVSFFYDDMPTGPANSMDEPGSSYTHKTGGESDPMSRRETLELVRAYYKIGDTQVRRRVFDLAKALAVAADLQGAEGEGPAAAPKDKPKGQAAPKGN